MSISRILIFNSCLSSPFLISYLSSVDEDGSTLSPHCTKSLLAHTLTPSSRHDDSFAFLISANNNPRSPVHVTILKYICFLVLCIPYNMLFQLRIYAERELSLVCLKIIYYLYFADKLYLFRTNSVKFRTTYTVYGQRMYISSAPSQNLVLR